MNKFFQTLLGLKSRFTAWLLAKLKAPGVPHLPKDLVVPSPFNPLGKTLVMSDPVQSEGESFTVKPKQPQDRVAEALAQLCEIAQQYVGVTEKGGDNQGPVVEQFQKALDGKAEREPWCAGFVGFCVKKAETRSILKTDIKLREHVMTMWNLTPKKFRTQTPKPGYVAVWNYVGTASGHCGIITDVTDHRIWVIEGNTNPDNVEVVREGNGVYRKNRSRSGTAKMKLMGYLKTFV